MGVDYRVVSGIGYEIEAGLLTDTEAWERYEEEYGDDLQWYLCDKLSGGYSVEQYGNGWTGCLSYVLIVDDPFEEGYDLTKTKGKLDIEVERLGVDTIGGFGVVGGIYIY